MPTKRPRLTITLTPEIDRALSAFSDGTGESRSSFIVQVLESSLPALETLAVAIQTAKRAKPEALARIQADMQRMGTAFEGTQTMLLDSMDLFAARTHASATRSEADAKGARRTAPNPPPPNRGGSTTKNTPKPSNVTPIRRGPKNAR